VGAQQSSHFTKYLYLLINWHSKPGKKEKVTAMYIDAGGVPWPAGAGSSTGGGAAPMIAGRLVDRCGLVAASIRIAAASLP